MALPAMLVGAESALYDERSAPIAEMKVAPVPRFSRKLLEVEIILEVRDPAMLRPTVNKPAAQNFKVAFKFAVKRQHGVSPNDKAARRTRTSLLNHWKIFSGHPQFVLKGEF
jgi:hypothetical protein